MVMHAKRYSANKAAARHAGRRMGTYKRLVDLKKGIASGPAQFLLAVLSVLGRWPRLLLGPLAGVLHAWAMGHWRVIVSSMGRLAHTPLTTLMTGAVIGIALALPAGLYVLLENVQAMGPGWTGTARISLFLKLDKTDDDARAMARALRKHPALERVEVITRSQALAEYQRLSGFESVFEALDMGNPLPSVLVLYPAPSYSDPTAIGRMLEALEKRDEVEIAQFDLQWLRRLYAMMTLIQRGILGLAALLALGVLLIVGNTIQLGIRNRREEIEITKLFGATNGFIRRPFLYTGLWYGLLGGVIAWFLVSVFFGLLHGPVGRLAALYHTEFPPLSPGADVLFLLLCAGAALGLAGSWVAVGRQLRAIEAS
uniref:Cell division protein FtsX n=1 Tax=Candidatus Kentrum eta TaxID=2126337 RepID=A0A450UJW3_9GAMM|nr:MAG: cell division transport system permease protein [Candidatus Kentron sp. H]VFJ92821.1 MAG: cell division transport system permease protein [Candidatus Kentron sp. H]VFJ94779.1 MAG: cell division transport system permease protein [Candidatus Kentron sp. H]